MHEEKCFVLPSVPTGQLEVARKALLLLLF